MAATVCFTVGVPGCGKTYCKVDWLVREYIPHHNGRLISNLPLNREAIAHYCAKRYRKQGVTVDAVLDRLVQIPSGVLKGWAMETDGPWNYFRSEDNPNGVDLTGAHVIIDEVHNYVASKSKHSHVNEWKKWLGELRHSMASIEFMSQDEMKVASAVRQHAAIMRTFVPGEDRREPFFGIMMRDWYELRGALFGEWTPVVFEIEWRKGMKGWERNQCRRFWLGEPVFSLYDSYAGKHQVDSGVSKDVKPHLFQNKSKAGLVRWFLLRNWWHFAIRAVIIGLFVWIVSGGYKQAFSGVQYLLEGVGLMAAPVSDSQDGPSMAAGDDGQIDGSGAVSVVESELLGKVEALESELEELRERQAIAGEMVALTPDCVAFRSGLVVRVGEVVPWGPFAGQTVRGVDIRRRCAVLDDAVLWLGLQRTR